MFIICCFKSGICLDDYKYPMLANISANFIILIYITFVLNNICIEDSKTLNVFLLIFGIFNCLEFMGGFALYFWCMFLLPDNGDHDLMFIAIITQIAVFGLRFIMKPCTGERCCCECHRDNVSTYPSHRINEGYENRGSYKNRGSSENRGIVSTRASRQTQ